MSKQADELKRIIEFYYPGRNDLTAIDFTYGTGALWWAYDNPCTCCGKKHVTVTKCDRDPNWLHEDDFRKHWEAYFTKKYANSKKVVDIQALVEKKLGETIDKTILKRDIFTSNYSDLGFHDIALFDPPYLIGRNSFDYGVKINDDGTLRPNQMQGPKSWAAYDLGKYVANPDVDTFNLRVEELNAKLPTVLKPNGLLIVKVMCPRYNGQLIEHDVNIRNILCDAVTGHFRTYDKGVYIRQGATTWASNVHMQNLHGYWLIFQQKQPPVKARIGSFTKKVFW